MKMLMLILLSFAFAQTCFANIPSWPAWLSNSGSAVFGLNPPLKINGQRVDAIRFGVFSYQRANGVLTLGRITPQGEWIDSDLNRYNPVFGANTSVYHDVYLRVGDEKFVIDAQGAVHPVEKGTSGKVVGSVVKLSSEVEDTFLRAQNWKQNDKAMELVYRPDEEFPQFVRLKEPLTVERYGKRHKLTQVKFDVIRLERPESTRLTDLSHADFGSIVDGKFVGVKSSVWRYVSGTSARHLYDQFPAGICFSMDPMIVYPSAPDKKIILRRDGLMKVEDRVVETERLIFKRTTTYTKGKAVCEGKLVSK